MTLRPVTMTCPYDGTKFEFQQQMSGTSFDRSFDFMAFGPIQSPWPLAVCPTNGFVFYKDDLTPEEIEKLRPFILSADYQALKEETSHYRAARIMERAGEPQKKISTMLLLATWEATTEAARAAYQEWTAAQVADAKGEKPALTSQEMMRLFRNASSERYRRYADELLPRLKTDMQVAGSDQERTNLRWLTGELLRRLGRFGEAKDHFETFAADIGPDHKFTKLVALQLQLVAANDRTIHMMSETKDQTSPRR